MFILTSLLISLFGLIIYLIQSFCYKSNQNTFKNLVNKDINWYKTHEDKWLPFINMAVDHCTVESLGEGKYIITTQNNEKISGCLGMYEDHVGLPPHTSYAQMVGIVIRNPYNPYKYKTIVGHTTLFEAECRCIRYNGDWDKYETWNKSIFRREHFYE